jgi:hypothetical protein
MSACDDFTRNVDGEIYDTYCYNKSGSNFYTLVRLPESKQTLNLVEEEIIIGVYENREYYFNSITTYGYFRVEITEFKGQYYTILDAIEKDPYVLEFLVNWCEDNWDDDELQSRDK